MLQFIGKAYKMKNKKIPHCRNSSKIPHCRNSSKIPHCRNSSKIVDRGKLDTSNTQIHDRSLH